MNFELKTSNSDQERDTVTKSTVGGDTDHITTSCHDHVSGEEIEYLLMHGLVGEYRRVSAEVSYWTRGEEMSRTWRRQQHTVRIPNNLKPYQFLRSIGFPEHDVVLQLERPAMKILLGEALREVRIWSMGVSSMQATLIYLTVKHTSQLTHPKQAEYFLHLVEAIVNNRLTRVSQLEAFTIAISKLVNGTITWKELIGDKVENEELSVLSAEEQKKRRRELEMMAQTFANCYTAALYRHLPLVAQAIATNIVQSSQHITACVEFLSPIGGDREVQFQELQHLLRAHPAQLKELTNEKKQLQA